MSVDLTTLTTKDAMDIFKKYGRHSDWQMVLAEPSYWSLRHAPGIYSVTKMTEEELEISILEDLSLVASMRLFGGVARYPRLQAIRHLGEAYDFQSFRILQLIKTLCRDGAIQQTTDDHLYFGDTSLL